MDINVPFEVEGRYWAEVHTGHVFDEAGKILAEGEVLRHTGKGKNKILISGFDMMGNNNMLELTAVAGTGNAAVTEGDTVLQNFKGFTNTLISDIHTVNSTPDVNGYVYHRILYRFSFVPGNPSGDLGSTPINVAEAGMATTLAPNAATVLLSRGLLVDGLGNPTTVSLNPKTEYLDLYWEVTFYVKAEVSSSVNLILDGVSVAHTVTIRPTDFLNLEPVMPWMAVSGKGFPCFGEILVTTGGNSYASCRAYSGPLANLTESLPDWGGTRDNYAPTAGVAEDYTNGNKYRDYTLTFGPTKGNVSGGVGVVTVLLNSNPSGGSGYWGFQVGYSPKIAKVNTKQLNLNFRLTLANR